MDTTSIKRKIRCELPSFCGTKRFFFVWIVTCKKYGFSTTVGNIRCSGLTATSLHNTFQTANCSKNEVKVTGGLQPSELLESKTITAEKYYQEIDELHQKLCQHQPAWVNSTNDAAELNEFSYETTTCSRLPKIPLTISSPDFYSTGINKLLVDRNML